MLLHLLYIDLLEQLHLQHAQFLFVYVLQNFLKIVKPELWHWGTYNEYIEQAQSLVNKGFIFFDDTALKIMRIPYHDDMLESPEWRDRKALGLIKEGLCKYLKSI